MAAAFTDIAVDDPNANVFQHLADVGIMGAYEDGGFHPEKIVTRAAALTIALRSGGISIPQNGNSELVLFTDVNPNEWYMPSINRALELGFITNGESFRPNEAISKAEFLSLLFRTTQVN